MLVIHIGCGVTHVYNRIVAISEAQLSLKVVIASPWRTAEISSVQGNIKRRSVSKKFVAGIGDEDWRGQEFSLDSREMGLRHGPSVIAVCIFHGFPSYTKACIL